MLVCVCCLLASSSEREDAAKVDSRSDQQTEEKEEKSAVSQSKWNNEASQIKNMSYVHIHKTKLVCKINCTSLSCFKCSMLVCHVTAQSLIFEPI